VIPTLMDLETHQAVLEMIATAHLVARPVETATDLETQEMIAMVHQDEPEAPRVALEAMTTQTLTDQRIPPRVALEATITQTLMDQRIPLQVVMAQETPVLIPTDQETQALTAMAQRTPLQVVMDQETKIHQIAMVQEIPVPILMDQETRVLTTTAQTLAHQTTTVPTTTIHPLRTILQQASYWRRPAAYSRTRDWLRRDRPSVLLLEMINTQVATLDQIHMVDQITITTTIR